MSSSGVNATNSGPLIIRTYNNQSSSNKTYLLTDFDHPVSSNNILITSTNGQLVPSNDIYVSSIYVSSILADNTIISTASISTLFSNNAIISSAYLSTVFSINSTITFNNEVIINNSNQTELGPQSLFVMGPTVITEPGAISTVSTVLNVYGAQATAPIDEGFTVTSSFVVPPSIERITFQIIGAGGSNSNSNLQVNPNNAGYAGYISADLKVKEGDTLLFTIGTVNNGLGTSLIYISSNVSTLVAIAGSGGGNGFASALVSSSSGGGHGGGSNGTLTNGNSGGFINGISNGTNGYDGLIIDDNIIKSNTDGGGGAISTLGGIGGIDIVSGNNGGTAIITFTDGGMTIGGNGGISTNTGGIGGGGFSGGGGGGGGSITSAGGGGGASFINFNQLFNQLSNVISLSGEFFFNNNGTAFGQGYGGPNTDGFATVFAYIPNNTIFTNGDIKCRVLQYEQLDPPISALGSGTAALWSLHPAIDTVHMNDNSIVECGGIQVDSGGIDVKNYVNIRAGINDTLGTSGFISQFIRTASSGTQTIDYQVANDSTGFGSDNWQDARYVYNSSDAISPLSQVWGIVTSSNITPVGSTIGDIHFYNSIYVDGNVGIGTINPTQTLDVNGNVNIVNTIFSNLLSSNTISSGSASFDLLLANTISSGSASFDLLSANTISSGSIFSNLLSLITISSSSATFDLLSSNTISSGSIFSNLLSSNTISSGSASFDLLSANTISSGSIFSNLLSSNTISSSSASFDLLSSNTISCMTLQYVTLSPNVVTSLVAGPGISISGGSGGPIYTGALTIGVTGVSLVSAYVIADYITSKINVIKIYSDGSTITTSSSFSLNTSYEIYSSNTLNFNNCQYIIIGGGGGGGGTSTGTGQDVAGGAGGGSAALVYNPLYLLSGITTINITVGSGGTGGINVNGNNGNDSIILLNPGSISILSGAGKGGNFGNTSSGGFASGGNDGNNTIQFKGGNGGQGGNNTGFNGELGNGPGGGLFGFGFNPLSANGGGGGGGGLGVLSIFPYSNVFSRGGDGGNASAFDSSPGVNGTNGIYGAGGGGGGAVDSSGGNGGAGFIALHFFN